MATLLLQEALTSDLFVATLAAPTTAASVQPGQFVHVRIGDLPLRRPFSVYRAKSGRIELLYRVKGKGTAVMAAWRSGASVDLLGPLGRGFARPRPGERIALVGGGIGVAPLAFFGERHPAQCVAVFGFRSSPEVCAADRLAGKGVEVVVTTEDGSYGRRGRVIEPLGSLLAENPVLLAPRIDRILTCGPWPMMAAVAAIARERGIACEAALEREMACGIGVCLGCVVETRDPGRPYLRVCSDGPVVPAESVAW